METLHDLFAHPLVARLGWSLAHFIWQGAVLAAVLAVVLHLLRRRSPNSRYLASTATMLLMVLAVPVTVLFVPAVPANLESPGHLPIVAEEIAPEPTQTNYSPQDHAEAAVPSVTFTAPLPRVENAATTAALANPMVAGPSWHERTLERMHRLMPWAVLAWFVGVLILSIRLMVGWILVQRLQRRFIEPAGRQLEALVEQIAARLSISRRVRVVRSACTVVPSTLGWLRPVILLPATVLTGLSREQLEAVIAHELAHIRRHDYLVNLLQSVVETLLFYHPAVWWVSRRMRIERENCCDDMAIAVCGNRVTYARALSDLETMRGTHGLLAAATGGSLVNRVRRILGVNAPAANPLARYASGLLVSAIVVAFLVIVEISSSRALAEAGNPAAASAPAAAEKDVAQDAETNAVQPQRWRHFERIVVGNDAITFQGKLTDWASIRAVIQDPSGSYGMGGMSVDVSKVRERNKHTLLELAWESDEIPQEVMNQARAQAKEIVQEYGYEYLSEVGVHPLSSKGSKSQLLPPLTQRGRWRHFARLTVSGLPDPMFAGVAAGDRGLGRMVMGWHGLGSIVAGLPEPQWTVLEVVAAPNSLTPEEYAERLQQIREQLKEAGLEAVKGVGVKPWAAEPTPSEFVPDEDQPGYWRHYVTLVVGPDAMTFEGRPVTHEQLRERLEAVPNKSETVLCIAAASQDLNEQAVRRQVDPALQNLGFNHVSYVGVHPLGTKGGPSIFTPTTSPAETSASAITANWVANPAVPEASFLHVSMPTGMLLEKRNDKLADSFRPLLEGEPSLRFDTPKTAAIRVQALASTPEGALLSGVVVYLPNKRVFYFWGSDVFSDEPELTKHFYGPFPGDALRDLGLESKPPVSERTERPHSRIDIQNIIELLQEAADPEASVRTSALEELRKNQDEVIASLFAALEHSDHRVRTRAGGALISILEHRAMEPLPGTPEEVRDELTRRRARATLDRFSGDDKDVETLVAALRDDDSQIRESAAQGLRILEWKPSNKVQQIWYAIGLGDVDEAARIAPEVQVSADRHLARGRLEYQVPFVVRLEASANSAVAQLPWLEFTQSRGTVSARLGVSYPSGPKAKWRAVVRLLDSAGKVLSEEGVLIENEGIIFGLPVRHNQTLKLGLGPAQDLTTAVRFQLTLEEAKDEGSPDEVEDQ